MFVYVGGDPGDGNTHGSGVFERGFPSYLYAAHGGTDIHGRFPSPIRMGRERSFPFLNSLALSLSVSRPGGPDPN